MTNYAAIDTRRGPLWERFAIEYASRLFGAEALAALPRFSRGPRKGQINAWLIWMRATSSGWCRECQSPVQPGSLVRAWIGKAEYSLPDSALSGEWLGRTQTLCGAKSVLGEDYRTAEMARQAARKIADAARWEEIKAEMQA